MAEMQSNTQLPLPGPPSTTLPVTECRFQSFIFFPLPASPHSPTWNKELPSVAEHFVNSRGKSGQWGSSWDPRGRSSPQVQASPSFYVLLEAHQLVPAAGDCHPAVCRHVCSSPHPRAVQGSVGKDRDMHHRSVCSV